MLDGENMLDWFGVTFGLLSLFPTFSSKSYPSDLLWSRVESGEPIYWSYRLCIFLSVFIPSRLGLGLSMVLRWPSSCISLVTFMFPCPSLSLTISENEIDLPSKFDSALFSPLWP